MDWIILILIFAIPFFIISYVLYSDDNDIIIGIGLWNDDMKKNIIAVCLLSASIACAILIFAIICVLSNKENRKMTDKNIILKESSDNDNITFQDSEYDITYDTKKKILKIKLK